MQLYEDNYVRLMQLVKSLAQLEGESQSIKFDDVTLHIQILERTRYTVTIQMTYLFQLEGQELTRSPDLKIRIYDKRSIIVRPTMFEILPENICLASCFRGRVLATCAVGFHDNT